MKTFIQLVLKGKTVVGMPQSLHYNNKDYERTDAEDWMARVREEVGEELARDNRTALLMGRDSILCWITGRTRYIWWTNINNLSSCKTKLTWI